MSQRPYVETPKKRCKRRLADEFLETSPTSTKAPALEPAVNLLMLLEIFWSPRVLMVLEKALLIMLSPMDIPLEVHVNLDQVWEAKEHVLRLLRVSEKMMPGSDKILDQALDYECFESFSRDHTLCMTYLLKAIPKTIYVSLKKLMRKNFEGPCTLFVGTPITTTSSTTAPTLENNAAANDSSTSAQNLREYTAKLLSVNHIFYIHKVFYYIKVIFYSSRPQRQRMG